MGLVVKENRGPSSENAVIFACDNGHLPLAMFAADRIRRIEPGRFDIVIAMPDISLVPTDMMDGPVRICEIEISDLPEVPMVKEWISFGTYFRWVLPSIFVDDYKTIFYLDTDTYLRRPGIQHLFDTIDPSVGLSAVTELIRPRKPGSERDLNFTKKLEDLGGRNGEYYNAGVLVMQPEPFLAMDGLRRFQDAAVRNIEFLPVHRDQDQGAMNLAFADDIVPLSPMYNWRTREWLNPRFTQEYDPIVLHFAGPLKPWDHQDNPFFRTFESEYVSFLEANFPGFVRKVTDGSAAWRYENPKHRIKLFEHIRVALYRRRVNKKFHKIWDGGDLDAKRAVMNDALEQAVVGRP